MKLGVLINSAQTQTGVKYGTWRKQQR